MRLSGLTAQTSSLFSDRSIGEVVRSKCGHKHLQLVTQLPLYFLNWFPSCLSTPSTGFPVALVHPQLVSQLPKYTLNWFPSCLSTPSSGFPVALVNPQLVSQLPKYTLNWFPSCLSTLSIGFPVA